MRGDESEYEPGRNGGIHGIGQWNETLTPRSQLLAQRVAALVIHEVWHLLRTAGVVTLRRVDRSRTPRMPLRVTPPWRLPRHSEAPRRFRGGIRQDGMGRKVSQSGHSRTRGTGYNVKEGTGPVIGRSGSTICSWAFACRGVHRNQTQTKVRMSPGRVVLVVKVLVLLV